MPIAKRWTGRGLGVLRSRRSLLRERLERLLKPYLRRICDPEPATYTASQAATVLQVSEDTIGRMVRRGVLTRVPYVDGKLLFPRVAVDALVAGDANVTPFRRPARGA